MYPIIEAYNQVLLFLEQGGSVLMIILFVIFFMWTLIIERTLYFTMGHRRKAQEVMNRWEGLAERTSWHAHEIRHAMLAEAQAELGRFLPMIKTLVALCPLLGLLGTVTGMIEVFNVMSVIGSGSARAMAAGISKATIPTMAGMVGALSGVFAVTLLQRSLFVRNELLADKLTFDH